MERSTDRLVSPREGARKIGFKSLTPYYALIHKGELPQHIKRGRSSFQLESDLDAYVAKLAATRVAG